MLLPHLDELVGWWSTKIGKRDVGLESVFINAAAKGDLQTVKSLMWLFPNNEDAFYEAVINGHTKIVKELWCKSVIYELYDWYDVCINNTRMVKYIVKLNNYDDLPFCAACEYDNLKLLKWLFKIDTSRVNLDLLIEYASRYGKHIRIVEYLAKRGGYSKNAYHLACKLDRMDVVAML